MTNFSNIRALLVVILSLGVLPVTKSFAQEGAQRSAGWTASCLDARLCEMKSELSPSGTVAARVGILNYRGHFMFQYTIPLGVDLKQGIFLRVDEEPPIATEIANCSGFGCTGIIMLNTSIIQSMKRGSNLAILFSSSINQDSFAITFSLSGFTTSFTKIVDG
jgi:invasion protein IalB